MEAAKLSFFVLCFVFSLLTLYELASRRKPRRQDNLIVSLACAMIYLILS